MFDSTSKDFIGRMIRDDRAFCRAYSPHRDKAAFEAAWAERASNGNAAVTQYLPNYAGSGIVWGETGARSGATGKHLFTARAGHHLAPQSLNSGKDLFEELGNDYALLNLGGDPAVTDAFAVAANQLQLPFNVISDDSMSAREAYEATYVLVRPDLFVAWAGTETNNRERDILALAAGY